MSLVRHTVYNVIGAVIPVIVSLTTIPFYLKAIGFDRYGILTIAWVVVGYFSFFDFGLGRATSQQIARAGDDHAARNRAFWTGMSLTVGLSIVGLIVAAPITVLVLRTIKTGTLELRHEAMAAVPMLVAAVPVSLFYSTLRGTLEGRSSFLLLNAITGVGAVATGILPLVTALLWGPAIPGLILTTVLVRIGVLIALAAAAARELPLRPPMRPQKQDIRAMVGFGAWLTITNVISPVMYVFDRFFIGAFVGTTAVALYVIPFNLVNQLLLIPTGMATALFPRFAADVNEERNNKNELVRATAFLLTPIAFAAVVLVEPFLQVWIGREAAHSSTPIAFVLMVGFWANGVAQLPFGRLQAAGRTDIGAKVHLIEIVPYLVLLIGGLKYLGLIGAALAWSVRGIADMFAFLLLDKLSPRVLRVVLADLAILTLTSILLLTTPHDPTLRWIGIGVIAAAIAAYSIRNVPPVVIDRVRPWLPTIFWKQT